MIYYLNKKYAPIIFEGFQNSELIDSRNIVLWQYSYN